MKNKVEKENIDLNKKEDGGLDMEQKEVTLTSKPETTVRVRIWWFRFGKQIQRPQKHYHFKMERTRAKRERRNRNMEEQVSGTVKAWDKVLVKHVLRFEKDKMEMGTKEEVVNVKRKDSNMLSGIGESSLDQILIKHKSRLDNKEKIAAASLQPNDHSRYPGDKQGIEN